MTEIDRITSEISRILRERERVIVAIDGRCAAGKTTLSERLHRELNCTVVHMDDFFLRPEQRTAERYAVPGGNVDRERLETEVLIPISNGKSFSFRPFDCSTMTLSEPVEVVPCSVCVIEGTYSLHPDLAGYCDLRVFMTVSPDEQLARIAERNPGKVDVFREKWIPLEEKYFDAFDIAAKADIVIET